MTPDEFLTQNTADGVQTDWMPFCDFVMKGKRLLVIDPGIGGDPLTVDVKPGGFVVEVKGVAYEGDKLIARMRVRAKEAEPRLGRALGDTGVDSGMLAVFDDEVIMGYAESNKEGYGKWVEENLIVLDGPYGVVPCEAVDTTMPYVEAGFGDGTFPVYELNDAAGRVVGIEVEFIKPGEAPPF